ncbi:MAG: hypothetical protein KF788_19075 [Piscinibacter sp.]|nr:hypothetical protein [Piscinibacter sp.]
MTRILAALTAALFTVGVYAADKPAMETAAAASAPMKKAKHAKKTKKAAKPAAAASAAG